MPEDTQKSKAFAGHWARPKTRTYEYNYQYSESYYQAQVDYLEKLKSTSTRKSRATSVDSAADSYRYLRAGSPPRAKSFSERWAANPFYGRYGYGKSASAGKDQESRELSYFKGLHSNSDYQSKREEHSRSRSQSVASYRQSREKEFECESSAVRRNFRSSSVLSDWRPNREVSDAEEGQNIAASVERARKIRSMMSSTSASGDYDNVADYRFRRALSEPLSRRINEALMNGDYKYIDAYGESLFPPKKSTADDTYPLGIDAYMRRRFVLGGQYLDAAALGGFDVLYDPTSFTRRWKLLKRIVEECEQEDITSRCIREESCRRQMQSSYQGRAASVLR